MYYEINPEYQATNLYTGVGANIVFSPLLSVLGLFTNCSDPYSECNSSLATAFGLAIGPLIGVEGSILGMPMFAEIHLDAVLAYNASGFIPTLSMGWRYAF